VGPKYDSIENINKKKEIWRLAVIVDDMWSVYKGDKETSLELIIRDLKVICFNFYKFIFPCIIHSS
jgi:hypothetical protein